MLLETAREVIMDEIANKAVPAGGWVMIIVLSEAEPEVTIKAKLTAVVDTWRNMRTLRKEPTFSHPIHGGIVVGEPSSVLAYRLSAQASGNVGETIVMLRELMSMTGRTIATKHLEGHVGGHFYTFVPTEMERPTGHTLN